MESNNRASSSSNPPESSEDEMSIYLEVVKTISLKVKKPQTIRDLKAMVHEKLGISTKFLELYFTGEHLKDDDKLVDCGIIDDCTISIDVGVKKLFVSITSQQKTIEVESKNHHTIENIKCAIQSQCGIHPAQYSLFYAGMLLESYNTVASLGIKEESTLHLVFNPNDVLSVSVKKPSGEILKMKVKVLYTVRDFKAILGSKVGVASVDVNLIYAGNQLEDSKTLACYDIRENSILEMILPSSIQIFIKSLSGETFSVYVCQLDTVKDVKNKVSGKKGIPVNHFSLMFSGKSLEDGRDLASYGIEKHFTLHTAFRPGEWNACCRHVIISVQNSGSELIKLNACRHNTIKDMKNMIFHMVGLPVTAQSLVFEEEVLEDDRQLASYPEILNQCSLSLDIQPMLLYYQISLSDIGGSKPHLLNSTTVNDLRKMIEKKIMKKPVKEVFLCGKALQGNLKLADYAPKMEAPVVVAFEQLLGMSEYNHFLRGEIEADLTSGTS